MDLLSKNDDFVSLECLPFCQFISSNAIKKLLLMPPYSLYRTQNWLLLSTRPLLCNLNVSFKFNNSSLEQLDKAIASNERRMKSCVAMRWNGVMVEIRRHRNMLMRCEIRQSERHLQSHLLKSISCFTLWSPCG